MGHINLLGKTSDQPGIGNQLQFQLSLDQTQLQDSLQSLEALVKKYPVRHQ
jgi:hypothetical protein